MIESVSLRPQAEGRAEVDVTLTGGKTLTVYAATPSAAAAWVEEAGFCAGPPVLYVSSLDEATVRRAVDAMSADLSGYWLRYYGSAVRHEAGK